MYYLTRPPGLPPACEDQFDHLQPDSFEFPACSYLGYTHAHQRRIGFRTSACLGPFLLQKLQRFRPEISVGFEPLNDTIGLQPPFT